MQDETQFNPRDSEYKRVGDLPKEQRKKFVDKEGGFVSKEVVEYEESVLKRVHELMNKHEQIVKLIEKENVHTEDQIEKHLFNRIIIKDAKRENREWEERKKNERKLQEEREAILNQVMPLIKELEEGKLDPFKDFYNWYDSGTRGLLEKSPELSESCLKRITCCGKDLMAFMRICNDEVRNSDFVVRLSEYFLEEIKKNNEDIDQDAKYRLGSIISGAYLGTKGKTVYPFKNSNDYTKENFITDREKMEKKPKQLLKEIIDILKSLPEEESRKGFIIGLVTNYNTYYKIFQKIIIDNFDELKRLIPEGDTEHIIKALPDAKLLLPNS